MFTSLKEAQDQNLQIIQVRGPKGTYVALGAIEQDGSAQLLHEVTDDLQLVGYPVSEYPQYQDADKYYTGTYFEYCVKGGETLYLFKNFGMGANVEDADLKLSAEEMTHNWLEILADRDVGFWMLRNESGKLVASANTI